jgi:phosphopantetheinyl transferase
MPFFKTIKINSKTTLYLWKISEELSALQNQVQLKQTSKFRLEGMKAESHQKGFLAVRMLLQHIGYTDEDLIYDENGKPHLSKGESQKSKIESLNISISHSHQFSAIVISSKPVGLDI